MAHKITLIPGDGVGPEVTEATRRVLEATGVAFEWEPGIAGEGAQAQYGTPLPEAVVESIRRNKVALKGPVTTPIGYGFRSVNVGLRKILDLYACIRPCRLYPGVQSRYQNVDILIVRENTEDLYAGIEFEKGTPEAAKLISLIRSGNNEVRDDSGFSIKVISEEGSRRIVKFALEYARNHGRKRVTVIHKANIMKFTDGLFLSVAREVARGYPDIQFDDMLIDALCMRLVLRPDLLDVIVLPNLYGDFVSELCAGLIGGLGIAPSANLNDRMAIFEATHGSAPKYAGQNKVNPMALMLSGVMMLRWIGEVKAAGRVESAIAAVLAEGKKVTYDLIPEGSRMKPVGTSQVAEAVIEKMKGIR